MRVDGLAAAIVEIKQRLLNDILPPTLRDLFGPYIRSGLQTVTFYCNTLYIPQHHQRTQADGEDGDHRYQVLLASLLLTNVQLSFVQVTVGRSLAVSFAVPLTASEIHMLVRRNLMGVAE